MGILMAGERIEVIEHSDKKYMGERGTVIHVRTGINPDAHPVEVNIPKQATEPRYSVALDDGGLLHDLREQQLRKLQGTTHQQEK
jgi:RNase P/RNase MRP subunit p29